MEAAINLEGKATIHRAVEIKQMCVDAAADGSETVNVNWLGCLGIDTSILQLLLAVSREKQLRGVGDPVESIREALALAGVDSSLQSTSNPE